MSEFESLSHKYNFVRKFFAKERYRKNRAVLFYRPNLLREICRNFTVDEIMDAIIDTMEQKRTNYFKTFIELLGETDSEERYDHYTYEPKQTEEAE